MKITMKTTVEEIIKMLKDDCEPGITSIAFHDACEGDEIPENFSIVITDNQEAREQLSKIYEEF